MGQDHVSRSHVRARVDKLPLKYRVAASDGYPDILRGDVALSMPGRRDAATILAAGGNRVGVCSISIPRTDMEEGEREETRLTTMISRSVYVDSGASRRKLLSKINALTLLPMHRLVVLGTEEGHVMACRAKNHLF